MAPLSYTWTFRLDLQTPLKVALSYKAVGQTDHYRRLATSYFTKTVPCIPLILTPA